MFPYRDLQMQVDIRQQYKLILSKSKLWTLSILQGSKVETSHACVKDGTEPKVSIHDKEEVEESDAKVKQRRSTRNSTKAYLENATHAASTMETVNQKVSGSVCSISFDGCKLFLEIKLQRKGKQNLVLVIRGLASMNELFQNFIYVQAGIFVQQHYTQEMTLQYDIFFSHIICCEK